MKRTNSLILSFLIILCMPFVVQAQDTGKKINLTVNKEALPRALSQVEQQSGYYKINYSYDELSRYSVSANIKNKTALEAVRILIDKLPYSADTDGRYIQIKKTVRPTTVAQANGKDGVSGRITDENGDPLLGATVMVPGTKKKAVTDMDGNFFIPNATANDVIEVSYIGKKTISRKAGNKKMNIIVADDENLLSDVVVTGYQTISKERTTGSFDKITAKELEARPTADLSSALQGMVAGMQATENADGTVSFAIRGQSTLYADAQPLVVVDGFPIEGSFATINPNDVESVTVLKDAAAASIWGT